ncbi:DnaB-like helicase C-terminal domain-containing protein [Bacillus sp. AG4(2022)]|uniref:DnaB-like helicase C-terminal domain-containing protein n=1 Tax=Bacillus sp. AG4(2022) TaxID=2962594 RepID=UPI002881AC0A|nr:DnaB-like helicase C-terminal domain-containing protein [Bacillus sp. AG4(2022)]MDT0160436.1 DnaB-like helicase C-terminal domain-containing protein [Bacillus sp. AG4(2022)]
MKYIKEFVEPSYIHESLLVGYLWANPSLFQKYKTHKVTQETFTEAVWYFYFTVGKQMFENGIRDFDDKTTYAFLVSRPKEKNKKSYIDAYNDFGGYDTISELMDACKKDGQNDEYHFSEIQKYESLRKLQKDSLINVEDKVLLEKLLKMSLKQVQLFITVKYKEAFAQINSGDVVEHDLVANLDTTIEKLNSGESMGSPLHDAPRLNRKIKGWKNGSLYYLVLSSGVGKSSIAMEKFILSLFENQEKALLGINEESVEKWRTLLLATISSKILKKPINREKLQEGNFNQETLNKLNAAKQWAEENGQGLVKTLELKRYRVEDILSRVELYRPKGYSKLIIDTFKPDRSSTDLARWEAFSNSAQDLHDLIKEDNYNVGTLATVQLKLGKETRYLDLEATGKSMEINEVAAVVMMGRLLFADEYQEEKSKFKLKPYNYKKDEFTGEWIIEEYKLDPKKTYLVLFLSKNRFGSEEEQIIYEVNYEINSFREVAFVKVPRYGGM